MELYANRGRDSNVVAFEIGADWIKIQFGTGLPYTYSYGSAGSSNVEHMKRLARGGRGLNSFVNTNAKYKYVR